MHRPTPGCNSGVEAAPAPPGSVGRLQPRPGQGAAAALPGSVGRLQPCPGQWGGPSFIATVA